MKGGPAVETVAVALLNGLDPIRLARLDGRELDLHMRGLARAQELRGEEMATFAKAIGAHVGSRVGEILAQVFK